MFDPSHTRTQSQRKIRYAFSLVRNALRRHPAEYQADACEEILREIDELKTELRIKNEQDTATHERRKI